MQIAYPYPANESMITCLSALEGFFPSCSHLGGHCLAVRAAKSPLDDERCVAHARPSLTAAEFQSQMARKAPTKPAKAQKNTIETNGHIKFKFRRFQQRCHSNVLGDTSSAGC